MPTQPYYVEVDPKVCDPTLYALFQRSYKRPPKDGGRIKVPGCTTVLNNMGWSGNALKWWAFEQGKLPENKDKTVYECSSVEADIGTIGHCYVEADVKGEEWDINKVMPLTPQSTEQEREARVKVERCMTAWDRFRVQSRLDVVEAEVKVEDPCLMFGGTLDLIARIYDDAALRWRYFLADIKTGKGFYENQLCQVAAYGTAWNRKHPDKHIEEYHIIRIGKEDASIKHGSWPEESMAGPLEAFKYARYLHELKKEIKRSL